MRSADSEISGGKTSARTEPFVFHSELPAQQLRQLLIQQRNSAGHWTGELSTSALSTATATMALLKAIAVTADGAARVRFEELAFGGLRWLAEHQQTDGGWGDTVLSISNISTSMLAHAVFAAAGSAPSGFAPSIFERIPGSADVVKKAEAYINGCGGIAAVLERYGKDHTFSVPILTQCALAGTVDWKHVIPLPFELSCLPAGFYSAVRLPVVSYALPALIAIGQVIFHHRGHWNPLVRLIRRAAIGRSLKVLNSIQPPHGGFLEAIPLTSFVCMSLLGCGLDRHVVTARCLEFIVKSVRPDGSWPIDTNLATWVTTLSVNALASATENGDVDRDSRSRVEFLGSGERDTIRRWLLDQQYKTRHPYTNSAPGGWSWTDLPGGVPDADDTPGAMLALMNLRITGEEMFDEEHHALSLATGWLLGLQNRDGGWPTFCRGWGTLPFDRSSCDLTAHALRAISRWRWLTHRGSSGPKSDSTPASASESLARKIDQSIDAGIAFLIRSQRPDGTWLPLWFGHQFNTDDENPLYGTTKVLIALTDVSLRGTDENTGKSQAALMQSDAGRQAVTRATEWLLRNQNPDGGWSARLGLSSSVEETGLGLEALSVKALQEIPAVCDACERAARWIDEAISGGRIMQPCPIGFYFAKLWYFEKLYPLIFAAGGILRWTALVRNMPMRNTQKTGEQQSASPVPSFPEKKSGTFEVSGNNAES